MCLNKPRSDLVENILRNAEILIKNADLDISSKILKNLPLPSERVDDWGFPSHGLKKKSCGSVLTKMCVNPDCNPDGLTVFKIKIKRCFSPKCPVCWGEWAKREADRISYRVCESQKLMPSLGKPIHVVVSVPKWLYGLHFCNNYEWTQSKKSGKWYRKTLKKDWGLRTLAYKMAEKTGFRGGSCILHHNRQNKKSGLWYFSPHFHFIGFGWISGAAVVYKSEGWIVKNIGVRTNVFGTALYQLTHCGIYYGTGRKHSVTWMGALSYNQMKKIPKKPKKLDRCPYCGEEMETVFWDGEGSPPLPCMGLDGFYLAKSDNWITREEIYWDFINPFKNSCFVSVNPTLNSFIPSYNFS